MHLGHLFVAASALLSTASAKPVLYVHNDTDPSTLGGEFVDCYRTGMIFGREDGGLEEVQFKVLEESYKLCREISGRFESGEAKKHCFQAGAIGRIDFFVSNNGGDAAIWPFDRCLSSFDTIIQRCESGGTYEDEEWAWRVDPNFGFCWWNP